MNRRKRVSVFALLFVVCLTGGVAIAAWLATGTGPAGARAVSAEELVVSAGTVTPSLYPKPAAGYPSTSVGAVYATVSNPNPYPVRLTTATFGTVTITPLSGQTCAAGSVVPVTTDPVALATPVNLAADANAVPVTLAGALEMVSTAGDGCQGATFSVQVTLSGTSI